MPATGLRPTSGLVMLKLSTSSHPEPRAGSLEAICSSIQAQGEAKSHLLSPWSARNMKRRDFLTQSALAGIAGSAFRGAAPVFARAPNSPNEKVRFACIGVGGKGDSDTNDAGAHGEIVGLCDIDAQVLDKMGQQVPQGQEVLRLPQDARRAGRQDRRRHRQHARPHPRARQRHGHADGQALLLPEAADLVDRGSQGRCGRWPPRRSSAPRWATRAPPRAASARASSSSAPGILGPIKEIHVWTNRPIWPQGLSRLKETPGIPNHVRWYEFLGVGARPALPPRVPAVQVARLARLRHRRPGRHGLPHHQHRLHGPRAVRPRERRGRRHLRHRRPRDLSRLVDHPHPLRRRATAAARSP